MQSPSGTSTPTIYNRQPRLQIPSSLPSLLQTELLLLDRFLRKNKPQHRSGLFHQKCVHVLRVMKRLTVVVSEVVTINERGGGTPVEESFSRKSTKPADSKVVKKAVSEQLSQKLYKTIIELINRAIPALTKAFEILEKMINHLHFLPLTTTLLAITSRMFVVTIDLSAYAIQYREAAQDLALHGQTSNGTLQSAIVKEKNKDKALLSLEDITEMLVSGRMSSGRMSMAQVQLEARLSALRESAATDNIGKGQITPAVLVEPKVPVMEMEGEDFGEAVEPIARAVPPKVEISSRITPTSVAPVVLDPPSSSEEDIAVPSITRKTSSVSTRISKNRKEIERVQDSPLDSSAAVSDSVSLSKEGDPRSPPLPTKKVKDKSRPVDAKKISGVKPQKRVGSAVIEDASEEATLKKKKKKGKDPMDDIFGL